jgi:DNA modification methylase
MDAIKVLNQEITEQYALYHGDCIAVLRGIPKNSVHYTIFSPPFASLFTYSNSERDMGNTKGDDDFAEHFSFLVPELLRVTMPGRLCSFHCMDIPSMKERDGVIGLKDFPGDLIRVFQKYGWVYHSKHIIWKDPLIEATRTKALGLMHKQLMKDSAMCRAGLPDYLITMRKPGENAEPIAHPDGLYDFIGDASNWNGLFDAPSTVDVEGSRIGRTPEQFESASQAKRSHNIWRKYASPVWMDINQTNTLQKESAREEKDERHICPLQLDVIERGIELWSNPGDTVLSPFGGIGSEPYTAIRKGRKAVAIELKESYYRQMVSNCRVAATMVANPTLFDGWDA